MTIVEYAEQSTDYKLTELQKKILINYQKKLDENKDLILKPIRYGKGIMYQIIAEYNLYQMLERS